MLRQCRKQSRKRTWLTWLSDFENSRGKTRAPKAARDMGVRQVSIFQAEEKPREALTKLRCRMIEAYSPFKVLGPVFLVKRK